MRTAQQRADDDGQHGAHPPAAVSPDAAARGRIRAAVVRHPVASFVLLAFVFSWSAWLPLLADRQDWVEWSASTYLHLLGGLGPLVAAVVVTALSRGREGLRSLWNQATAWRGRGRWLALAALGPLALFTAVVVVARLVDGQWPALSRFGASTEYPTLPLAAYWLASLVFYGFGEEVGWRGYLQPTLERRRPALQAAVLLSVVWALWHLPLFGITDGYRQMAAVGFIGFYLSLLVAALVFAWLWHRSGRSLLVVAIFHAVFDIATTTPASTTLIPTLMGVAITLAGLAAIPALRTISSARATGG
jgi:membrane protease YdiL (CAAX protease family)